MIKILLITYSQTVISLSTEVLYELSGALHNRAPGGHSDSSGSVNALNDDKWCGVIR